MRYYMKMEGLPFKIPPVLQVYLHPNETQRLGKLVCWTLWQKHRIRPLIVATAGVPRNQMRFTPKEYTAVMEDVGLWLWREGFLKAYDENGNETPPPQGETPK